MLEGYRSGESTPGQQTFPGSAMLELDFAALSDVGKLREHNEDCLGHVVPGSNGKARERGWLFALADGVGGQDRGEVASRIAIETLQSGFQDYRANESPAGCLQRLIQAANTQIYETAAATGPDASSMCTTIVACLFRFDRVTVANVGDSRCYLIRRGRAEQLTHDHSLVEEQVRMGILTPDEAAESDRRHLLSRSLGVNGIVNVDLNEHQVLPGDILLLSSDGFHGSLTAAEIAIAVCQLEDLNQCVRRLIALALERDGSDNISVQLIRIKQVERMGMYRGRPYKLS